MKDLFRLYKQYGSHWVTISKYLPGHSESDAKNKFYTTLKRVATQAQIEDPIRYGGKIAKCKKNLVQFVDIALKFNHLLPSKKGRKRNSDKLKARTHGILFPKNQPQPAQPSTSTMNFIPYPQLHQDLYFFPSPYPYVLVPLYKNGAQVLRANQEMSNVMVNQENGNYYCGQYQSINH